MAENGELLFFCYVFLTVSALLQCTCTFQLSKRHPHTRHKHKKTRAVQVWVFSVTVAKKRVRYSIELVFTSEEERTSFKRRWTEVKTPISPGGPNLENTPSILKLSSLLKIRVDLLLRQCPRQALSCRKQV